MLEGVLDNELLLKCDRCKWHAGIDAVCRAEPCPNCGYSYNYPNLVIGTQEELEKYIEEHLT